MFSEEALIASVRNGDDTAFAVLIERYMPMLRQETSRVSNNSSDDDDFIQEASLGLLSAAKAYRCEAGASFKTFARICVRRRLLNAVQAFGEQPLPQDDLAVLDDPENDCYDSRFDPNEWLLHKEEETALLDRLKSILSSMEYHVLVLHMASYSYDEIASTLHISSKSVDNALQRIRRKLVGAL